MKITVVKVTTPIYRTETGKKAFNLNLRKHSDYKEIFIDPWVSTDSPIYKKKVQEIFYECGELMDQTTDICDVKADLIYTINGVTHLHQTGIPYSEEIANMHLADYAQYSSIIDSYCAGRRIIETQKYKGGDRKMTQKRYNRYKLRNAAIYNSGSYKAKYN